MLTKQEKTKKISLQDEFLNDIKKNKDFSEVNLVNGLKIKCKIINYDNFSLLINENNSYALIYKHSIAFIKKLKKNFK